MSFLSEVGPCYAICGQRPTGLSTKKCYLPNLVGFAKVVQNICCRQRVVPWPKPGSITDQGVERR